MIEQAFTISREVTYAGALAVVGFAVATVFFVYESAPEPPIRYGDAEVLNGPVKPGDDVRITYWSARTKICPAKVHRSWVVDENRLVKSTEHSITSFVDPSNKLIPYTVTLRIPWAVEADSVTLGGFITSWCQERHGIKQTIVPFPDVEIAISRP